MFKSISNQILKGKLDDRLYRYVRLSNSLKCLLVHDKDTEMSSACMFVGSGSLCDPMVRGKDGVMKPLNGMAHFCEHMVGRGTKKFPEENHYRKFMAAHGGHNNAATNADATYYYFDIKNDYFSEALDIFSS